MKKNTTKQIKKEEILRIQAKLAETDPGTEEYQDLLTALEALENVQAKTKSHRGQLIAAVIPLIGTALILNYENLHVVTSKALALLPRNTPKF